VVPRRFDAAIARGLQSTAEKLFAARLRKLSETMARLLPEESRREDPRRIALDHYAMRLEDMWGRARGIGFQGWHPEIEIEGIEHVRAALARGRGAVVWSMRFSSATALKQAFHRAGLPLVHLSRVSHGASSATRTGLGIVGSLYCRAENPYLAERVRIPMDGSVSYINTLRRHLRNNLCVNIFGEHTGRQNAPATVLGLRWPFALGAPSLAWSEDAALLTAYTLRTGSLRYHVVVDKEIPVDRSIGRREFARQAVVEFARRLETLIVSHPADWQGWLYREFP
jgi:lauroyl/myristoyl acyltransferase